ncbi:Synaptobrevin [Sesbania bispinosa]|nr:Synaptobrevin [Sesbania bispinosa]
MYRSPPRPLPYDADPRYFRSQHDGIASRCEKGSSHLNEESDGYFNYKVKGLLTSSFNGSTYRIRIGLNGYTVCSVARGSVVLAEFSGTATNASTIAKQILDKIPATTILMFLTLRIDTSSTSSAPMASPFSVWPTTPPAVRRIPFAFLEEIHQRFVRTYGRAVFSAQPYGMNDEFSRVLSQQMEYYSNDPNADRINRLKGEMSQVRNVMIENIDKVLDRGDRLELLVDKTANMQGNTFASGNKLVDSEALCGGEMSSSHYSDGTTSA